MEESSAITPQTITELKAVPPEDIAKISESVIEATQITGRASEELEHLSNCLADFSQTHDEYLKRAKHVKNQMRYITTHI